MPQDEEACESQGGSHVRVERGFWEYLTELSIPLYVCTTPFTHSPGDGHLGYFRVLAVVSSAALNIGLHESFWIIVLFGCMPRNGIAGSYGKALYL